MPYAVIYPAGNDAFFPDFVVVDLARAYAERQKTRYCKYSPDNLKRIDEKG